MEPFPGASVEEKEKRCKELQTELSVWRTEDDSTVSLKIFLHYLLCDC